MKGGTYDRPQKAQLAAPSQSAVDRVLTDARKGWFPMPGFSHAGEAA
jgi:hypothetical protein